MAGTGSQPAVPTQWRMGLEEHQECWVWKRDQDVGPYTFPQFLRLPNEDNGPPRSSACSGRKAEAFRFGGLSGDPGAFQKQ